MKFLCFAAFFVFTFRAAAIQEDPNRFFRNTDAQPPETERRGFHVPEGFEVQLFAEDSQLGGKPVNMSFDARGRLWVTCTREYPFAVKKDKWSADTTRAVGSKDTIRILEDTDGDGRADKVTVFATDMNIPTGVLPYKNGCIAWSIPNILYLEDTRAAGNDKSQKANFNKHPAPEKADKRTILFGPLGYEKDTHGMISSFRRGLDGWVYATHGFSNTSHFAVRPENLKSQIPNAKSEPFDITSGSVFRFKPDGSQVELFTSGQVNPFGLCWDSWGNLYSADCHSAPIYQLIRGASYPQFGKKPDALGFGPVMCEHAHGSTGICGPVYIDGGIWGLDWDDHMFVCNPVTSKINHDFITFTGSTPKANEQPDFLTSDDPWFRPVDLQLGPDSALYIADFYNRIIGHYEVPLDHPGRDRASGRIWRIVKKGNTGRLTECDLRMQSSEALLASVNKFQAGNLTRSHLACDELAARGEGHPPHRPFSTWDTDPHGCRNTLASHMQEPSVEPLEWLPSWFDWILPGDTHLRHAVRVTLRNQLALPGGFLELSRHKFSPGARLELLRISTAVPSAASASWLLDQMNASSRPATTKERDLPSSVKNTHGDGLDPLIRHDTVLLTQILGHIARQLPLEREGELIELVQKHLGEDLDTQLDLFAAIRQGKVDRQPVLRPSKKASEGVADPLTNWADSLAMRLMDSLQQKETIDWQNVTPPSDANPSPWFKQMRNCGDGTERAFLCSLPPGGEKLTGTLRSKAFDLPKKLTFWIAGHRGFPKTEAHEKNLVRLVDEKTGAEIAKAYPPRNDIAQLVSWELSETEPGRGHLELVDGDNGTAYAWLAVGGFSPEVVEVSDLNSPVNDKRIRAAAELASTWLTHQDANAVNKRYTTPAYPDLARRLNALPHREAYSADTRVALARLSPLSMPDEVPQLARDPDLVATVFKILEDNNERSALVLAFKTLPSRSQIKLASALASSPDSAKHLLKLANPTVLADPLVSGKLNALNDAGITRQLKAATASLPAQNDSLNKLIAGRLKSFDPSKADAARGQDLFMRTCSVCHRIGVKGNLVGPQLDGVGARGAERLIEDILDPNRAVDPAFRLHIVKLKSGGLMTGLLRREQDDEVIFCDAAGQEHSVKKSDVANDQVSPFSLMPSGFGEVLKEGELHDLMKFLLERKS